MSNKYEREIEEILRNMDQTDPRPNLGQKFSERLRRKSQPRPPRQRISLNFSTSEWLLIVAIITALVAGGYAFAFPPRQDIFSTVLAIISIACLLIIAISPFINRSRQAPRYGTYGNVTITPLRRNPFSMFKTRWNLFVLKLRYRRRHEE
jgi:hypothetical protein